MHYLKLPRSSGSLIVDSPLIESEILAKCTLNGIQVKPMVSWPQPYPHLDVCKKSHLQGSKKHFLRTTPLRRIFVIQLIQMRQSLFCLPLWTGPPYQLYFHSQIWIVDIKTYVKFKNQGYLNFFLKGLIICCITTSEKSTFISLNLFERPF